MFDDYKLFFGLLVILDVLNFSVNENLNKSDARNPDFGF